MSRNKGSRFVSVMFVIRCLSVLLAGGAISFLTGCGGGISLNDPNWYGGEDMPPATTSSPGQKPKKEPHSTLPPAPFELGEVVAKNDKFYREFWGMTPQGYYSVQDFYQKNALLEGDDTNASQSTTAKRTDPYTLVNLTDVQSWMLGYLSIAQQYNNLGAVEIEGPYVQWYPNGEKAIAGSYKNGRQQGVWTLWYDNGKMMLQETLAEGSRQGESKGWHKNGSLAGSGSYVDNMRHGIWTVWYENGAKMQEGSYDHDMRSGLWTFYYENGSRKEAGAYENGEQTGVWQWWDRSGVLVREGPYSETAPAATTGSGRIRPRYTGASLADH